MIAKKNKRENRERERKRERESARKPYIEWSRKEKKERIGRCIVIGRTKCH